MSNKWQKMRIRAHLLMNVLHLVSQDEIIVTTIKQQQQQQEQE